MGKDCSVEKLRQDAALKMRAKAILQQNVDTMNPAARSGTNGAFRRGASKIPARVWTERNLLALAGLGNTNGVNRCKRCGMRATIAAIPVSHEPSITTLFGPRKSAQAVPPLSTGNALWNLGRFVGRALVSCSMLLFLLSGYLALAHYWIQTRWTKSEATVLSGELRQFSSGSTSGTGPAGHSSKSYFFHCTVSYSVAGETRRSQLDSPGSTYQMDAQVWASNWSPGRHVVIRYKDSNPNKIRLDDNPSEITAMGSLRVALYFLIPGALLILTSRPDRVDFR